MGLNNIALIKLYEADQALRAAQQRLDLATREVRIQERRSSDVKTRLESIQNALKATQTQASASELDLKSREAHIEKLRAQQQTARNNKEYQALLIEINTQKIDRTKAEETTLHLLEKVEREQAQAKDLAAQLEGETTKLTQMRQQIGDRVATLQAEIEALRPARQQAANAVTPASLHAFERLADRLDGEAMSPLAQPNPKVEEYICSACNINIVTDTYNHLYNKDDLVYCTSCGRILYIPENLTPDRAVKKKKISKPRKPHRDEYATAAPIARQSSAVDVLESMRAAEPESESPEPPVDTRAEPELNDSSR
ncbi:MAG: hypothetical protein IT448_11490 [Phycisphaerales bacterium]|nr:hypothetical protein [Phycisphaerales bacterium]